MDAPATEQTVSSARQPLAAAAAPLAIHDLTVAYQRKPVVWDIDYEARAGRLIAIVGPNGAGKSTLIKASLNLVPRISGEVLFFGEPYKKVRHRVAYVPQRTTVDWDFPVSALDVVAMGLYREIGWCWPVTRKYRAEALEALKRVGMEDFSRRQISQLSGGQQQRVFLARALAQQAELFLMDEPFAGVDAATEQAIIGVLRELRSAGDTVIVVHHDLQTVSEYFDDVLMMNMRLIAHGPVDQALTPENLRRTYGGKLSLVDQVGQKMAEQRR